MPGVLLHPFHIPHVVDKILNSLDPKGKDIYTTRLVCKQWAEYASEIIRHHKILFLRGGFEQQEALLKLLEMARSSKFLPFGNFHMHQDVFRKENLEFIKEFMLIFALVMESLTIWLDCKSNILFTDEQFYLTDERFRLMSFPKLKKLRWDDERNSGGNGNADSFLCWILEGAPNLENFSLLGRRVHQGTNINLGNLLLTMSNSITIRHRLKNLISLKLDFCLNDNNLLLLTQSFARSPLLQELDISLHSSKLSGAGFLNFLSIFKNLEKLIIALTSESKALIKFPIMKTLKSLEVNGCGRGFPNVKFCPFSYSTHFPILKILRVDAWKDSTDWQQLLQRHSQVITLEQLHLPEEASTFHFFSLIPKSFPMLKKLFLSLSAENVEILQIIFQSLPLLEELQVRRAWQFGSYGFHQGKVLDHIFTGISQTVLTKFKGSECDRKQLLEFGEMGKVSSAVKDLTFLKRLQIEELHYLGIITDITILLGFFQMQHLQFLDLGSNGKNYLSISPKILQELGKRFPSTFVPERMVQRGSDENEEDNWSFLTQSGTKCNYL